MQTLETASHDLDPAVRRAVLVAGELRREAQGLRARFRPGTRGPLSVRHDVCLATAAELEAAARAGSVPRCAYQLSLPVAVEAWARQSSAASARPVAPARRRAPAPVAEPDMWAGDYGPALVRRFAAQAAARARA